MCEYILTFLTEKSLKSVISFIWTSAYLTEYPETVPNGSSPSSPGAVHIRITSPSLLPDNAVKSDIPPGGTAGVGSAA